jgi:hypothetical protein
LIPLLKLSKMSTYHIWCPHVVQKDNLLRHHLLSNLFVTNLCFFTWEDYFFGILQHAFNFKHWSLMMSLTLRNPKWSKLFLEPFRGCELSKNKVQWLDFAFLLWLALKGLPFAKIIYTQFAFILQFLSYSWFKQFEGSSSRDPTIVQLLNCFPCLSFHVG